MRKYGRSALLGAVVVVAALAAGCNDADGSLGVEFLLEGEESARLPATLVFRCDETDIVAQIRIRGPGGSSPEHTSQFAEGGPSVGVPYLGVSLEDVSPAGALVFHWNGALIAEGHRDANVVESALPFDPDLDVGEPAGVLTVSAAHCDFESATFTIVAFEFEYLGVEELNRPGSALAGFGVGPINVLGVQQQSCRITNSASGGGGGPPPPGPTPPQGPRLAAGSDFSLARLSDGTLQSWGSDLIAGVIGTLGDGPTDTSRDVPGPSGRFVPKVVAVSAGLWHALALLDDGTVWGWGYNGLGQLGNGHRVTLPAPVQMTGPTQATAAKVAVAAGTLHSLVLRSDGVVEATGWNLRGQLGNGQLGDGMTNDRLEALPVPNLTGIEAIAAGGSHSLALDNSGDVWAWGGNDSGQVGDGTATDRPTPITVTGLSGMKLVAAGEDFSMAADDLTIWAWGSNTNGKLGDGTEIDRSTPVQVDLPPSFTFPVKAIAAGGQFAMALDGAGLVFTWGINEVGQLGNGSLSPGFRPSPAPVAQFPPAGRQVVEIAAGKASGLEHALALLDDGTVWAWGYNDKGQLGNGDPNDAIRESPVQVVGGLNLN